MPWDGCCSAAMCKAPEVYSLLIRGYIVVPSVAGHAVGFTGWVHNLRLRILYLPPMHTTIAQCTLWDVGFAISPLSMVKSLCLGMSEK